MFFSAVGRNPHFLVRPEEWCGVLGSECLHNRLPSETPRSLISSIANMKWYEDVPLKGSQTEQNRAMWLSWKKPLHFSPSNTQTEFTNFDD